jgi:hypothetical protein
MRIKASSSFIQRLIILFASSLKSELSCKKIALNLIQLLRMAEKLSSSLEKNDSTAL